MKGLLFGLICRRLVRACQGAAMFYAVCVCCTFSQGAFCSRASATVAAVETKPCHVWTRARAGSPAVNSHDVANAIAQAGPTSGSRKQFADKIEQSHRNALCLGRGRPYHTPSPDVSPFTAGLAATESAWSLA
jgi:hypothetical protein